MKDLHIQRRKLDEIDDQIVDLISKRFKITNEIGLMKAQNRLQVIDQNREDQVISRLAKRSKLLSVNPDLIGSIYRSILSEVVRNHTKIQEQGSKTK